MTAMARNAQDTKKQVRALFAGDGEKLKSTIKDWPTDIGRMSCACSNRLIAAPGASRLRNVGEQSGISQRLQGRVVVGFVLDLAHQFAVQDAIVFIEHDDGSRRDAASGPFPIATP